MAKETCKHASGDNCTRLDNHSSKVFMVLKVIVERMKRELGQSVHEARMIVRLFRKLFEELLDFSIRKVLDDLIC